MDDKLRIDLEKRVARALWRVEFYGGTKDERDIDSATQDWKQSRERRILDARRLIAALHKDGISISS